MATLSLGNQTIFTQSGSDAPVMDANVNLSSANIKTSFNSLDTTASQGPTTDLTNTSLPIFACRAWVHFNGGEVTSVNSEDHCTIRASGNISKVVRNATGLFTIYFDTPMPDTNYAISHHIGAFNQGGQDTSVTSARCYTADVNFYKATVNYSANGGSNNFFNYTSISFMFFR